MKLATYFFISFLFGCISPSLNKDWSGDYLVQKGMAYNGSKWIYSEKRSPLNLMLDSKTSLLCLYDTSFNRNRLTFHYDNNLFYLTLPDTFLSSRINRIWLSYFDKKIPYLMNIFYDTPGYEKEIRMKSSAEFKDKWNNLTLLDFTIVLRKKDINSKQQ